MPTRLVLDCDTGTDDAVAIMAAVGHPDLDLLAVTTVDGNVALPFVTENTLRALDVVGALVPVHAGAPRPLLRPGFPIPRDELNGRDPDFQPAYLDLPPARSRVASHEAVRFLVDFYRDPAHDDVTLVATGPLTNVALALSVAPDLRDRIPRLVLMGGGVAGGNVTAAAEFNLWVDPEAARIVLEAGVRDVTTLPLDATQSVPLTLADCDALHALGTPGAVAAARLVRHRIEHDPDAERAALFGPCAPVHDALCMAAIADPSVVTESVTCPVTVETSSDRALGALLLDRRSWTADAPNATVALRADRDRYLAFLTNAFRA
ncbi:nucleoside hydrolase [Luteimicrobium sp. NPDC057192]|uniref:nucleoside hydrolase n=1 Tax=Luteimicrobium sp. NPDC057192 TaxID=3346042 RepID=UPI003629A66B